MTTAQLIEKKKKEFDEKYLNLDKTMFTAWILTHPKIIKSFLHSFALELIETVSEEIIGKDEKMLKPKNLKQSTFIDDMSFNLIISHKNLLRDLQRHYKDQIINSIKK
jgi:hypothetical protein